MTGVAKNTIQKLYGPREIANHKWSIEEMVDLLPEATHPRREKLY